MRLLLDTHALAWWLMDSPKLPVNARQLLADPGNVVFVSAISAYEAAYKHKIGKWPEIGPLVGAFEEIVENQGFALLPITAKHAIRAAGYDAGHGDPFDRILAAQAAVDGLTLVSDDRLFRLFEAQVVWRR